MKVYNEAHLNILTTTKDVYINQIINYLQKFLYEGILSIYKDSMDIDKRNRFNLLKKHLGDIPKWNSIIIDSEYKRFLEENDEKKFERLIRATFLTYTKILSSVKMNQKKKTKVTVVIPDNRAFIHNCYIESAREFYKNVNLLDHDLKNIDKQKNLKESLIIINDSIKKCIECMLPIDDIISQNLLEESEESEEESDEEFEEESEEESVEEIEVEDEEEVEVEDEEEVEVEDEEEVEYEEEEYEEESEEKVKDESEKSEDKSNIIHNLIKTREEIPIQSSDNKRIVDITEKEIYLNNNELKTEDMTKSFGNYKRTFKRARTSKARTSKART